MSTETKDSPSASTSPVRVWLVEDNAAFRRTVARVATIEKAAAIAGLPVPELVRTLRSAAGLEGQMAAALSA